MKVIIESLLILLVKVEDQELQKTRQELTQTKSVRELSQINGISDFPLPSFRKKTDKEGNVNLLVSRSIKSK